MARFRPIKNSFVAGELSQRLEGRDDLDQYPQSMRQAENGIVLPHGGFLRRTGTRFVANASDHLKQSWLAPFIVSTDQAYIVEFADLHAHFFVNEGQLFDGGPHAEVTTPYVDGTLADLQWTQEADVMWVVHLSHPPYKLQRTGPTTFTFTKVVWRLGRAPLQPANLDTTFTVTVSGSAPSFTLTFSDDQGFTTGADIGRAIRSNDGTNEAWYEIDEVVSGTVVKGPRRGGAQPAGANDDWALGLFSDSEGCRAVTFHQGRLFYGGWPTSGPDLWRLSVSDDFDFFEIVDPAADDAENADKTIARRTVAGQVNAIMWAATRDNQLVIGTSGGEFRVRGANDDVLTPGGTVVISATTRGSKHVKPLIIDNTILFVQRNGRKLREYKFSLDADAFTARDISILAEHIYDNGGGCNQLAFQQDPDGIAWGVRDDGQIVGFTFEPEQKVIGAHRQLLGGSFGTTLHGIVESIAVIPEPNETEDQVWVVVKRTIDGVTKRYIEFMEDQFRPALGPKSTKQERIDTMTDAFFMDSGLTYDDVPATVITGLDHLEGETVVVLVDGGQHPTRVVSGGQITLARAGSVVHVGLAFKTIGETQRFIGGSQIGTDQGQPARIGRVTIRFHNSLGGEFGSGSQPTTLERPLFRGGTDPMDQSPPIFTGDKNIPVPGGWTDEPTIYFEEEQPAPLTILAIIPVVESGDG